MEYVFGAGWALIAGAILCVVGDDRASTHQRRSRLALALTVAGSILIWIALHAAKVV